jgi:hypothetical protein
MAPMNQQPQTFGKDWPAFGAAVAIGLWECAALLRARVAAALRAHVAAALRAASAHAPMKRRR